MPPSRKKIAPLLPFLMLRWVLIGPLVNMAKLIKCLYDRDDEERLRRMLAPWSRACRGGANTAPNRASPRCCRLHQPSGRDDGFERR